MPAARRAGVQARKRNRSSADHLVPTSKGGRNVLSNYAVRCWACNSARQNRELFFSVGALTPF